MTVKQIKTQVQRGTTVVFGGKTDVAGNGLHHRMERLSATCLSILRPTSRLSPRPGHPALRRPLADQAADSAAASGAGRSRSRVLVSRCLASLVGWPVQYGWSPCDDGARFTDAKPSASQAYRGRPPASDRSLTRRMNPASPSGNEPGAEAAQFGSTAGAFTASLRGKRAG